MMLKQTSTSVFSNPNCVISDLKLLLQSKPLTSSSFVKNPSQSSSKACKHDSNCSSCLSFSRASFCLKAIFLISRAPSRACAPQSTIAARIKFSAARVTLATITTKIGRVQGSSSMTGIAVDPHESPQRSVWVNVTMAFHTEENARGHRSHVPSKTPRSWSRRFMGWNSCTATSAQVRRMRLTMTRPQKIDMAADAIPRRRKFNSGRRWMSHTTRASRKRRRHRKTAMEGMLGKAKWRTVKMMSPSTRQKSAVRPLSAKNSLPKTKMCAAISATNASSIRLDATSTARGDSSPAAAASDSKMSSQMLKRITKV
mmetsp:Transcript_95944/g.271432  ORF Transcript_95944/g.271432 Transcript_95944/m.271432 type:complete len:313 (-) Transcript_95944:167-1105(-)